MMIYTNELLLDFGAVYLTCNRLISGNIPGTIIQIPGE
jgi:hypothetical protein